MAKMYFNGQNYSDYQSLQVKKKYYLDKHEEMSKRVNIHTRFVKFVRNKFTRKLKTSYTINLILILIILAQYLM